MSEPLEDKEKELLDAIRHFLPSDLPPVCAVYAVVVTHPEHDHLIISGLKELQLAAVLEKTLAYFVADLIIKRAYRAGQN